MYYGQQGLLRYGLTTVIIISNFTLGHSAKPLPLHASYMTSTPIIQISRWTTILSFLGGLFLVVAYFFTYSIDFAILGLRYLLVAFFLNLFVLVLTALSAFRLKEKRPVLIKCMFLQLGNVPIAVAFALLGSWISNTVHLIVENKTNEIISEVSVVGCQNRSLGQLSPDQREHVFLQIPGECAIKIEFTKSGKKYSEVVAPYVSKGGGFKMDVKLGNAVPLVDDAP